MQLLELIWHSVKDTIVIIPFLFLTYLLMEYLEHRAGNGAEKLLKRSGQFGAVVGGALGLVPQCGFSSAAAGLYSARVISMGTLISVFLSTSDEMIPIFIARPDSDLLSMLKILAVKLGISILAGVAVDLVLRAIYKKRGGEPTVKIDELCERDKCHCHSNLLKSTLIHTGKISAFILIFTFVLNFLVYFVGEDTIAMLVLDKPVLANILAAVVGLIPNCASSVIISELFIGGVISAGALMSGLLVNSGVALAVLFRTNRPRKNTFIIVGIILAIAILAGIVIDLTPIARWIAG